MLVGSGTTHSITHIFPNRLLGHKCDLTLPNTAQLALPGRALIRFCQDNHSWCPQHRQIQPTTKTHRPNRQRCRHNLSSQRTDDKQAPSGHLITASNNKFTCSDAVRSGVCGGSRFLREARSTKVPYTATHT